MRILFIGIEDFDSGITVYERNVINALRKRGIDVGVDGGFVGNYDIIHIHGRPNAGILPAKIRNYAPIVTTTHMTSKELEGLVPDKLMWLADVYLNALHKVSKKIFVTAPNIMERLSRNKELRGKLVFLPYPMEISRFLNRRDIDKEIFRKKFSIQSGKKMILCVASIQKRKGIYEFIETAKKLPDYVFVWVGRIPPTPYLAERGRLKAIVGGKKPGNLIFAGPLYGDKLVEAYYAADIFWLPSKAETFGLVVVEAAACGKHVLLRNLPVYKPFSGFAVTYKSNPKEKIIDLLENPEKYKKLIQSGKASVKKYDINKHVDKLVEEYEYVIGKSSTALIRKYSGEKMPLISVIVPTLNEEKYIEKCLMALSEQTIPRKFYEIIVSDSSSSDQTVGIAKRYADKVVVCKKISAGHGRNFGAKKAAGKYFVFVDADTVVNKKYLEGAIQGLEKGIACTGPIEALEKGSKRLTTFYKSWGMQSKLSISLGYPIFPGFNFAVRKNYFRKLKGFREDNIVVEDMDMSLRLGKLGKMVFNKKMGVETSTRRLREISPAEYILNAAVFAVIGRSRGWDKHRKDFQKK